MTPTDKHLHNLLARIHRDGGHYTEKHGLVKSVADADLRVAELNAGADDERWRRELATALGFDMTDPASRFLGTWNDLLEMVRGLVAKGRRLGLKL